MLFLVPKLLMLIIALLVGVQVIDRWSVNTGPLLTYQNQNEIGTTATFHLVYRAVKNCFTADGSDGSRVPYGTKFFIPLNTQGPYPIALYERASPAFFGLPLLHCVAAVCLGVGLALVLMKHPFGSMVSQIKTALNMDIAVHEEVRTTLDDQAAIVQARNRNFAFRIDSIVLLSASDSSQTSHTTVADSSSETSHTRVVKSNTDSSSSPEVATVSPAARPVNSFNGQVSTPSLGRVYTSGDFISAGYFNLKVLDVLGEGGQAIVYRVRHGPSVFAAKLSHFNSTAGVFRQEFSIMSRLSHPNIVNVFYAIPRGFLLEHLPEDLLAYIDRAGPIGPRIRDSMSLGIIQAVCYIHALGIVHLDIKPDNILLTYSGTPKLTDFGLAMYYRRYDGSIRYLDTFCASLGYAPPELLRLTSPVDMCKVESWSLGVTFFIMMTCCFPFDGKTKEEIVTNQLSGNYYIPPHFVTKISRDPAYSSYMNLVRRLCIIDPRARFSPSEALAFYWPNVPRV